jgi:hypothetical protein
MAKTTDVCPTCKSIKRYRRGMFFDGPCQDSWHDTRDALDEEPRPPGPEGTGHDPKDGQARPLTTEKAAPSPTLTTIEEQKPKRRKPLPSTSSSGSARSGSRKRGRGGSKP